MSDTLASLRHKLTAAGQLGSVVRAMKAVAATSIAQYEAAVEALRDYAHCVEHGLSLCLRSQSAALAGTAAPASPAGRPLGVLIFGSDQGLVGRFNEVIADFTLERLRQYPGPRTVWVVGDRIRPRLEEARLTIHEQFALPGSVPAITSLVTRIQIEMEEYMAGQPGAAVHVFHNSPRAAPRYEPQQERLLPLDAAWRKHLADEPWPGTQLAEVLGGTVASLPALVHEYLFIALYKACAESLASEHASRLESMQRAEKNIETLSRELQRSLARLRQSSIDEELFDVVAGFNALGDRT